MPKVSVVQQQHSGAQQSVFLLKVVNPTLGTVRLRFTSSSYQGELAWEQPDDDPTNDAASTSVVTPFLPHLLVDTLTQERRHVHLLSDTSFSASDTAELLSGEDSIIEMGGRALDSPPAVQQWSADEALSRAGDKSSVKLVAHSASNAWYEVVVMVEGIPEEHTVEDVYPGVAIQLQVELGNGSWETSLIQAQAPVDGGIDWVNFDLVLTWKQEA